MPLAPDSVLLLFPGALGDFVCFLPTVHALRRRHTGTLRIIAKPELLALIQWPGCASASIDRHEIADLFTSGRGLLPETKRLCGGFSTVYSWTGSGNPEFARRLASLGGEARIFPFRGMQDGEHAIDYYGRCVGVIPQALNSSSIVCDVEWLAEFRQRHRLDERALTVVHPGSGAARKNWQGFRKLVRHWSKQHGETVVVLRGPAECEEDGFGDGALSVEGLSLAQVAALLHDSRLYVGSDSGISHLAGAVGARGVVLFGPSEPAVWAPRGERMQLVHAPAPCRHCGPDLFCVHRLPVEQVTAALLSTDRQGTTNH